MPNNVQITTQLCFFCMLARLFSKFFKLGFNSMGTENFQMYKLGCKETEEPEIKLPALVGSQRKQGNFRKKLKICFTDFMKGMHIKTTMKY